MFIPTGFNTWVDNWIAFQLGLGFLESSKSFHMRMIVFLLSLQWQLLVVHSLQIGTTPFAGYYTPN